MSQDAKTLLYWISNAESLIADNEEDMSNCYACAFKWAQSIIAEGC